MRRVESMTLGFSAYTGAMFTQVTSLTLTDFNNQCSVGYHTFIIKSVFLWPLLKKVSIFVAFFDVNVACN